MPRLTEASDSLTEVAETISSAPESVQGALKNVIGSGVSRLTPLADTALVKEGVGSVLSPVVGPMMETLKGLAE